MRISHVVVVENTQVIGEFLMHVKLSDGRTVVTHFHDVEGLVRAAEVTRSRANEKEV